jgi:hypothetical protein
LPDKPCGQNTRPDDNCRIRWHLGRVELGPFRPMSGMIGQRRSQLKRQLGAIMSFVLHPWQLLLSIVAGWIHDEQQKIIDYQRTIT